MGKDDYKRDVLEDLAGEDEKKGRLAAMEWKKVKDKEKGLAAVRVEEETSRKLKLIRAYYDELVMRFRQRLLFLDWPLGFRYEVRATDEGVAMIIKDNLGNEYGKGFTPVFDVKYDINAINVLAHEAESTVDMLVGRGLYKPEKGGKIWTKERRR